jgi:hypothetical protein
MTNFRREPIRSRKLLASARGQPCTLEFVGVCSHNPETTISAHIHDETFGKGMKADDFSTVHSCDRCHMFLDHGWVGKISRSVLLWHVIRALQRTLRNRIERQIVIIPRDLVTPSSAKPVPKRKPPGQRAKVPQRENAWPPKGARKMPTRQRTDA